MQLPIELREIAGSIWSYDMKTQEIKHPIEIFALWLNFVTKYCDNPSLSYIVSNALSFPKALRANLPIYVLYEKREKANFPGRLKLSQEERRLIHMYNSLLWLD